METLSLVERVDYPKDENFPNLIGKQTPTILREAPGHHDRGDACIELARRCGFELYPWQKNEIRAMLATKEDGKWVHDFLTLICTRQNGKSLVISMIALYRAFVMGQKVIFTSYRTTSVQKVFEEEILKTIERYKWLEKHVVKRLNSQGKGLIRLDNGGELLYTTRSGKAARGQSGYSMMVYDEAFDISDGETASMGSLIKTGDDPQIYAMSSAVHRDRRTHSNGQTLSGWRHNAINNWDVDHPVYYSEYAAPEGLPIDSVDTWALANPSLGGGRYSVENILTDYRSAVSEIARLDFGTETLGWGLWYNPDGEKSIEDYVINPETWEELAAENPPELVGDPVLALDVSPNGEEVAIVSASMTKENKVFLSIAPVAEMNVQKVVHGVLDTAEKVDPVAVIVDPIGASAPLADALMNEGIDCVKVKASEVVSSAETLLQLIAEDKIIHDGNIRFIDAIKAAKFRNVKDTSGRAFTREGSESITALVTASFAAWGVQKFQLPEDVRKPHEFKTSAPVIAGNDEIDINPGIPRFNAGINTRQTNTNFGMALPNGPSVFHF